MAPGPSRSVNKHLVVQAHDLGRRDIVPAEWIETVVDDAIVLNRWRPEQTGVPALEMSGAGAGLSAA